MNSSKLISTLQNLVTESDAIFSGMTEVLPLLFTDLNRGLQGAGELLETLSCQKGEDGSIFRIQDYLEHCLQNVEKKKDDFACLLKTNAEVMSGFSSGLTSLNNLDNLLESIRHDSESIEIISLNALIAASKSGKKGAAFSVVTRELKWLSRQNIELSGFLESGNLEIQERFSEFSERADSINKENQRMADLFSDTVNNTLHYYLARSRSTMNTFQGLTDKAKRIEQPLKQIMENIQFHDIFSQSVNHLIMAVEEAQAQFDLNNSRNSVQILDLIISIINEIQTSLREKNVLFSEDIESISYRITQLSETDDHLQSSHIAEIGISDRELEKQFDIIKQSKSQLLKDGFTLADRTALVKHHLSRFKDIETALFSIVLASRIEVARERTLSHMDAPVRDMHSIVKNIEAGCREAFAISEQLEMEVGTFIKDFQSLTRQESEYLTTFIDSWKQNNDLFSLLDKNIHSMLSYFSRFGENFLPQLANLSQGSQDLGRFADKMESLKEELKESRTTLASDYPNSRESEKYQEEESPYMEKLIQRFTIFSQKKYAGIIGNFEIEETNLNSGEVTLF